MAQSSDAGSRPIARTTVAEIMEAHWRLIAIVSLSGLLLSTVIATLLPNKYTAIARILPPQQGQASVATALLAQLGGLASIAGNVGPRTIADTYAGLLRSRTVGDSLIDRFDLRNIYREKTMEDTRLELRERTLLTIGKDGLIAIAVEDKDPKRAAGLANAYVQELQKLTSTLAITEAAQRRAFFEEQLRRTKNELANAEIALKETQQATGLIKLDDQGRAIIENIARLRALVTAREVQMSALRSFATAQNPDLLRVQNEVARLKQELRRLEGDAANDSGSILLPTLKVPESGLAYVRKLRDVKYQETLFEVLARQYEAARVDEARDTQSVQLVDHAVEPDKKSSPRRGLIVALSTLIACFIGVIAAYIREMFPRERQ